MYKVKTKRRKKKTPAKLSKRFIRFNDPFKHLQVVETYEVKVPRTFNIPKVVIDDG